MPDKATKPKLRFELRTALWWSLVPLAAIYAVVKIEGWIHSPGDYLCLHWDNAGLCTYSMVAVNSYWLQLICIFASLSTLWLVRRLKTDHARDPHPLVVGLGFLGGSVLCLIALLYIGGINGAGMLLLLGAAGVVGAGAASCIRAPRRSVLRAVVTIAVPIIPLIFFALSVQSRADIRQTLRESVTYKLSKAAASAAEEAEDYPNKLQRAHATEWLQTPLLGASDEQREIIEDDIGAIDATGPGLDLHKAVGHMLMKHSGSDADLIELAADFGREGVWRTVYVFGREATGFCMTKATAQLDPDEPVLIESMSAKPNMGAHHELSYCVLGETLLAFDEQSDEPRRIEDVECLPDFPASPYSSAPTEEATSRYLRAIAAEDRDAAAQWVDNCLAYHEQAPPQLHAARLSDEANATLNSSESSWSFEIREQLGGTATPIAEADSGAGHRASTLRRSITQMLHSPTIPQRSQIEPVFGPVVDLARTRKLELALENRLGEQARTLSDEERIEQFGAGIGFVRHIIGARRAGWCKFNARAELEPGSSDEWLEVKSDYQVRYCLAGQELVSFDEDGAVERTWDARGMSRSAPLAGPSFDDIQSDDAEALETYRAERERIALLEQFYEQLTTGRLDDVAQLEMLAMAEGAKTLDKASLRAMRRMVAQNAEAAAGP